MVVDDNGKFREDSFSEAMGKIGGGEGGQSKRKSQKEGSDCFKIVNMIMERNFAPVIIFSFSKKECEAYALQMSKLDFNSSKLGHQVQAQQARKFKKVQAKKLVKSNKANLNS